MTAGRQEGNAAAPGSPAAPGPSGDGAEPGAEPGAKPGGAAKSTSRAGRAVKTGLLALVAYGLTLTLASDSFFWFAIPGFLGLVTLVIVGASAVMTGPVAPDEPPYATDGSDPGPAVKHHYATLAKRFAVLGVPSLAAIAVGLLAQVSFLYPLVGVGIVGFLVGLRFYLGQTYWVRRCARILKEYDLTFRAPVKKLQLQGNGRRVLSLGEEGRGGSPVMSGRDPMFLKQWPVDIADGVWFAGDDAFGGALLVPGTGELMCVQPREWNGLATDREAAGTERRAKAKRAGLDGHSM